MRQSEILIPLLMEKKSYPSQSEREKILRDRIVVVSNFASTILSYTHERLPPTMLGIPVALIRFPLYDSSYVTQGGDIVPLTWTIYYAPDEKGNLNCLTLSKMGIGNDPQLFHSMELTGHGLPHRQINRFGQIIILGSDHTPEEFKLTSGSPMLDHMFGIKND